MFKDLFKKNYTVIGKNTGKSAGVPETTAEQPAAETSAPENPQAAASAESVPMDRSVRESVRAGRTPEEIKEMWRRCNKCERPILVQAVKDNFYVCPECGGYFRVHAYRRIEMIIDEGTFEAVSYTHLDVYKRQVMLRCPFSLLLSSARK